MRTTGYLEEILKSLMFGSRFDADIAVTAQSIEKLINAGLGPVFFHVLSDAGLESQIDVHSLLRASDVTARLQSAEQFEHVEHVIGLLQSIGTTPILLKGASLATNFYPKPHLRIMGDIDLLLPPQRIDEAEAALIADGFEKPAPPEGMDYDSHIHSAPLCHKDRKLWIELHRRLLPAAFPASKEAPLDLSDYERELEAFRLGTRDVYRFRAEFEILYLAAGWCKDLTHDFNRPGAQRSLVDCTLLLKARQHQLDWDTLLKWSRNTLSGSCLLVLLSCLKSLGVFPDPDNICRTLARQQRYVSSAAIRLMISRIDKHLNRFVGFGRLSTPTFNSRLFDALIRKDKSWKNLLALPGRVFFPRHETYGHSPSYHFGRVLKFLRRNP